jgi:hypothetical protein
MTRLGPLKPVATVALAAFHASFFYKELSLHNIILEGDVLQVVKAMSSNIYNWSRFRQLVDDTRIILNSLFS